MDGEGEASTQDSCYGGASIAGAVIGTFLTTILLLAVAALVYRQWRRHKAKHLVFATCTEIVEDAYAFDNPCFKDATPAVNNKNHDGRPLSTSSLAAESSPTTKDSAKWSTPWSSLVFTGNSANKNDRRRTLDDSCLGPKATRVSIVGLRSHDFTGLGFNVCGNMREGIFVKDLLHRGPASESGRIHPGDRIASVKISFRNMVYEDALTILSYASPYDVELEVEHGGNGPGSRPTTLLKKTVGPSPSRICHPLYRSQSIPELSQTHKTSAKRLFIADPNESTGSNYSTMNSGMKSWKSTSGNALTLEKHQEDSRGHNNHQKFGIKVLPALDGTVHRIENQNEHNTNLERRNSRKTDVELTDGTDDRRDSSKKSHETSRNRIEAENEDESRNRASEGYQKRENPRARDEGRLSNSQDVTDLSSKKVSRESDVVNFPSEVPAEVHNAAMAARRNRKNSMELLSGPKPSEETNELKSPQKNKRKAPAPPVIAPADSEIEQIVSATSTPVKNEAAKKNENPDDSIESITDYAESLSDYVGKVREGKAENDSSSISRRLMEESKSSKRRKSETDSDNDSEIHDSFTTIELKPADITIHHRPVQMNGEKNDKVVDDDDESDDVYRKAASLGDLSKYENKSLATLERAQSLDMADTGTKKRKLVTPDDINESTEDLTKIEDMDTFDRRKLKKSNEWGTLEDAIWKKTDIEDLEAKSRTRKRSNNNGTLERSRSAIEMKLKDEDDDKEEEKSITLEDSTNLPGLDTEETSIELYNLPLSIKLTREFLHTEKMFDPDEDNSLLRIVNNGRIVKSPTPEEMELDFRRATPDDSRDEEIVEPIAKEIEIKKVEATEVKSNPSDDYNMALRYLDEDAKKDIPTKIDRTEKEDSLYVGRTEVQEEPMRKVKVITGCPGCDRKHSRHDHDCEKNSSKKNGDTRHTEMDWQPQQMTEKSSESIKDEETKPTMSAFKIGLTRFEKNSEARPKSVTPTESRIEKKLLRERGIELDDEDDVKRTRTEIFNETIRNADEDEESYDFGSGITVNSKILASPMTDRHNVSNVSVSSGENSEDSGLVGESGDYARQDSDLRPPLPETPVPSSLNNQKLTYITEINVSTSRENSVDPEISTKKESFKPLRNEINLTANGKTSTPKKPPVPPRRNDASRSFSRDNENSDKNVVYVSEYKSSGKDRNENTERVSSISDSRKTGNKKFENWIYLGENKDQNPWGSESSQQQPVTNIVVAGDEQKTVHQ